MDLLSEFEEISVALVLCREKPEIRVVVLTGEGDKASGIEAPVNPFTNLFSSNLIFAFSNCLFNCGINKRGSNVLRSLSPLSARTLISLR